MMDRISFKNPRGVSDPLGPYSHAIEVPSSARWLYIAGQVSVNERGDVVGENHLWIQMQQVFTNLDNVLAGVGYGWNDVVKTTTYLTRAVDVDEYRQRRKALYEQRFGSGPYPGNTLVVVERLALSTFLLEIEAVAARPPAE